MKRNSRLRDIFQEPPLAAFKRDVNLNDMLVHSKHNKIFSTTIKGTQVCAQNCTICKYFKVGNSVISKGREFRFNDCISWKTSNLVYGIFCEECKEIVYVGETGVTLYERFQNHISSIRNNKNEPIPNHFNGPHHELKDLKIVGIEKIRKNDIFLRKIKETFWIKKLQTLIPVGLNQNEGLGEKMY